MKVDKTVFSEKTDEVVADETLRAGNAKFLNITECNFSMLQEM